MEEVQQMKSELENRELKLLQREQESSKQSSIIAKKVKSVEPPKPQESDEKSISSTEGENNRQQLIQKIKSEMDALDSSFKNQFGVVNFHSAAASPQHRASVSNNVREAPLRAYPVLQPRFSNYHQQVNKTRSKPIHKNGPLRIRNNNKNKSRNSATKVNGNTNYKFYPHGRFTSTPKHTNYRYRMNRSSSLSSSGQFNHERPLVASVHTFSIQSMKPSLIYSRKPNVHSIRNRLDRNRAKSVVSNLRNPQEQNFMI